MSDNRTNQPTPKRRRLARQEGRVAASNQLVGVVVWVGMATWLFFASGWMLRSVSEVFSAAWSPHGSVGGDPVDVFRDLFRNALAPWWTWLAMVLMLAIAARVAQTGLIWAPQRLLPDGARFNPSQRLKELFSPQTLLPLARGAAMLVCGLSLLAYGIWDMHPRFLSALVSSTYQQDVISLLAHWGLRLGGCFAVFAVADFAYQRYRFERSLRMTPEEVRAEVKAVEGNPQVASERHEMHRRMTNLEATETHGAHETRLGSPE